MTFDEWKQIAQHLAALYPASKLEAASIAAYYQRLQHLDAQDVANAASYYADQPEHEWFPPVGKLRALAETEAEVRREHEHLPDFTGVHALPEAEREELHRAGLEASSRVLAGSPPGEPERIRPDRELAER